MLRRPPRSTRTDTLFPYTTLFRSLLNGFLSKEMFLSESLAMHSGTLTDQALPYLATLPSAFAVLYSVRFIHQTLFGPAPVNLHRKPDEAPIWMRGPIALLALACLITAIVPAATLGPSRPPPART